jgi:uncharacterized protein
MKGAWLAEPYSEFLFDILFFGAFSFFMLWIAKANGFFTLPYNKRSELPLKGRSLAILFGFYLGITLIVIRLLIQIFHSFYSKTHPNLPLSHGALGVIQLVSIGLLCCCFFLYARAEGAALFKRIWKDKSLPHTRSIPFDIAMGLLTFFVAFPVIALIGECVDMLLYAFFGLENYEQVAVRYLKTNISSARAMLIPLFTILIAAPTIEEFLFRGCLQTFLKNKMSIKKAIFSSSLCFALFHFAPTQGLGNISLIISLFSFALFLGFIYERQASLFASISLHITFNGFSTIRILFFSD